MWIVWTIAGICAAFAVMFTVIKYHVPEGYNHRKRQLRWRSGGINANPVP